MKIGLCLASILLSFGFLIPQNNTIKRDSISPNNKFICGGNILFTKSTKIEASTFNGKGSLIGSQITTVISVDKQATSMQSTTTIQTLNIKGKEDKLYNTSYTCDGKNFSMDMRGMMDENKNATVISTTGMAFPLILKEGEILPEANQIIEVGTKKTKMKMLMNVKNRKVESKEKLTNLSGTYEVYKISAIMESTTKMDGVSEAMQNAMDAMRKKMGEQKMIIWYSPEYAVLKMEMYSGNNLVTRTEVTKISKGL